MRGASSEEVAGTTGLPPAPKTASAAAAAPGASSSSGGSSGGGGGGEGPGPLPGELGRLQDLLRWYRGVRRQAAQGELPAARAAELAARGLAPGPLPGGG